MREMLDRMSNTNNFLDMLVELKPEGEWAS
jgi:hypothetical protein